KRAGPRHRAPDHLFAGTRPLSHRAAALLRLLDARPPVAIARTRVALHSRDELHGPGGGRLVHPPRYADAHLPPYQSAAVLPDLLLRAGGRDPGAGGGCRAYFAVRFSDRRHRAHQPAGRESRGSGARLARALAPRHRLLRARCRFGASLRAEAREWLATATLA